MASPPRRLELKHNKARSQEQTEVTIHSGNKFMILKDLLCAHSDIFATGLRNNRKLYLPDISDETFELFQFWLCGQATRQDPRHVSQAGPIERELRYASLDWVQPEHTLIQFLTF
jgi:hypothetical protein